MKTTQKQSFPKWIFAFIAIGALMASGVYLGIMSVEGFVGMRIAQAVGFGILGLLMFWGAISKR